MITLITNITAAPAITLTSVVLIWLVLYTVSTNQPILSRLSQFGLFLLHCLFNCYTMAGLCTYSDGIIVVTQFAGQIAPVLSSLTRLNRLLITDPITIYNFTSVCISVLDWSLFLLNLLFTVLDWSLFSSKFAVHGRQIVGCSPEAFRMSDFSGHWFS